MVSRKNKRVKRVTAELNNLSKNDIYSLMLFTLYKLKDNPDFLTLSELAYVLEGNSLSKFLGYFGGMTLTIPTLEDMRLTVQALLLYNYVNVEKDDFNEALKSVVTQEFSADAIKKVYQQIVEVMGEYRFDTAD